MAVANHALSRIHVFNQLVWQLTTFNARHAGEILSDNTDSERRKELASTAASLSMLLHREGIGEASLQGQNGQWGWYGALVATLDANKRLLESKRGFSLWRQLREWPYTAIDLLVLGAFAAVVVAVLW